MQKDFVTVVYDRRKEVTKNGHGAVEIRIYLGNGVRKYVTIHTCNPFEWKEYQNSEEVRAQLAIYRHIVEVMVKNGEELTLENLDNHLGVNNARTREKREVREKKASKTGFIDFMLEMIAKEQLKKNTMRETITSCAYESLIRAIRKLGTYTVCLCKPIRHTHLTQ